MLIFKFLAISAAGIIPQFFFIYWICSSFNFAYVDISSIPNSYALPLIAPSVLFGRTLVNSV